MLLVFMEVFVAIFLLFLIFNNDEYDSQQIQVPHCTFLIKIEWVIGNTCRIVLNAFFDREESKLFFSEG